MTIKIGLLAGEPSGDNLAAGLMAALRQQLRSAEQIEFIGVGGPAMIAQGLHSLAAFDALAVNGFKEPLLRLPELWRLYRRLAQTFKDEGVDAFIGIDFNVFNLLSSFFRLWLKDLDTWGCKFEFYIKSCVI